MTNERLRATLYLLCIAVLVLALAGAGFVFWQSYQGRVELTEAQRVGCMRDLFNTADSIAVENDDAQFREDAAAARRATGDVTVANRYDKLAGRARARARRREGRLLGADVHVLSHQSAAGRPSPAAVDEAAAACKRAYPDASPWPWSQPHPLAN